MAVALVAAASPVKPPLGVPRQGSLARSLSVAARSGRPGSAMGGMPLRATRDRGAPRAFRAPSVRSRYEVSQETGRCRLVDPGTDPAAISDVRRLEEPKMLDEKRLLLRLGADGDARPALVDLENRKRAPGDAEVGMTPRLNFSSSGQSHTKPPNPTQRIGELARAGRHNRSFRSDRKVDGLRPPAGTRIDRSREAFERRAVPLRQVTALPISGIDKRADRLLG